MNLPNKLTLFRVFLIPFFVFFLLAPEKLDWFVGYGNYIEDIEFNDLNGGLTQSIGRIPDVAEEDYPPEWLNLDALTLFPIDDTADSDSQKGFITFK